MRYRAIVFEYADINVPYGGVEHKETGEPCVLQVRDIFEGSEQEVLEYGIDMEAESYIHHVHVEAVNEQG